MTSLLWTVLTPQGFEPHGYCFLWTRPLLWLYIVSDSLITLSYYSIPIALIYFVRKRRDLAFNWVFLFFAVFIIACGTTHLLALWMLWSPLYWLDAAVKAVTAASSVVTAVAVWPLIPKALALPGPAQLQAANLALQEEIRERNRAQGALRAAYDEVETRVRERTRELTSTTEALQAEIAKHKRTEQALRESENRYRAVVDETNDGLFVMDAQGVITFANRSLARIHGVENPEHLVGRNVLEFVTPIELNRTQELLARAAETGTPTEVVETQIIRPDGKTVFAELTPVPILKGGRMAGFRGVVRDVTEHKRLEDQLRQAQKLEAIGLLAGGVAHDFNNLLSGIIGFAELALEELPKGSKGTSYLSRVPKLGRQAAGLIGRLLAFARKAPLERRPLDLGPLLKEGGKLLQRTFPETITIQVEPAFEPLIANADLGEVQQIILNLATNARDAMPHGGTLTLRLVPVTLTEASLGDHPYRRPGAFACLTVADTGTGIPSAIRDRIFEPFFTTKAPGHGTGLGLASVHGIVHQHEGWLEVETAEGQGSAFHVFLPIVPIPADAMPLAAEAMPHGRETVLLVEDNPIALEMGEILLSDLGYTVLTAADGVEALTVFRTHPGIALVLTDAIMPRMGAVDLIPALRALTPDIKVLVVTGYAADEIRRTLDHLGISGYIRKPFSRADLATAVRAAIDGPTLGRR